MDITIHPRKLSGVVQAIPSKSQAHRLLICAALADNPTELHCPQTSQDIEATVACLQALGADIVRTAEGYHVTPITKLPDHAVLPCAESGSTLRFMLPIVGALGINGTFQMSGRLPCRPLSPMWEEMERMGCHLSRPTANTIVCTGKLKSGVFTLNGGISSQFITGLLFGTALLPGCSQLTVIGTLESRHYVTMTQRALSRFGIPTDGFVIYGNFPFSAPGSVTVEGDWSNGAFFLAANALGSSLKITNLDDNSVQGDRICAKLFYDLQEHCTINASDIPDLVPILSVVAAANQGATFTGIQRLRLKESDRVASIIAMLSALGGHAEATQSTLTVFKTGIHGGVVDSANDHRIAMSAAIAATVAAAPVTILNAQCVFKSYPTFWKEYQRLGGQYEQYIR